MSFRCEGCNEPQVPYTKPVRIVLESRKQSYLNGNIESYGTEIVREGNFDEQCAKLVRHDLAVKAAQAAERERKLREEIANIDHSESNGLSRVVYSA